MKKSVQVLLALLMATAIAVPAKGFGATLRAETDQEPGSEEVELNEKNFPDAIFRSVVQKNFDKDKNKKLSAEEIKAAEELDVTDMGIKSLKGVEYLQNLSILNCVSNSLTELDLSKNINLLGVDCAMNELTKLDVSNCVLMQALLCDQNYLKTLDLSDLKVLNSLSCNVNDLAELDVSHNPELAYLNFGTVDETHVSEEIGYAPGEEREINNHISKLDLSNNPMLFSIYGSGNKLRELDFSHCPEIGFILCERNELTKINVANCKNLMSLNFISNKVKTLDLTGCSNLSGFHCADNQITALDFSDCENLTFIEAPANKLKTLKLCSSDSLMSINVEHNQMESLDVSEQYGLQQLLIDDNNIKSIDVTYNRELMVLDCGENPITKIDISNNKKLLTLACISAELETLTLPKHGELVDIFVTENKLKSLDVSNCLNLQHIIAEDNKLTEIDVTKLESLDFLFLGDNDISKVDLTKNPKLRGVGFRNNKLTELDLSRCQGLAEVELDGNNISDLKLPKEAPELNSLLVRKNQISELDVSGYPALRELFASENKLSKLDVTNNPMLETLTVHGNNITSLDISSCDTLLEDLGRFGVSESEDGSYFFSVYKESPEEEGFCFFSVDTKVDLKGYDLPEPSVPVKPADPTFEDFVERLYTVALGRESDSEGKTFWVKQVVEEGKTGADCARFFLLDADEFMKRNLSTEDFVETLYKTFFDRESDAEGKKGWVDAISSGAKTRAEVVNDFIESTEWCDVCATYGVKSGAIYHKATKASKNAINFATRLYTCCLKRDAEDGGLKYWSLALTNLEKTGAEAALFFFESDEFKGFNTTDKEYLTRLYTTFMDREPAQSEVDYWLGEIAGGRQTRHSILAFFAQSEEFTGICKQYGIDRGTIA